MTKKDYELVARVVRDLRKSEGDATLDRVARTFAEEFALLNPRFNIDTFLRACGVEVSS